MTKLSDRKSCLLLKCDVSDEDIVNYGIYKIRNLLNDKVYIGQAYRPFIVRWLEHQGDLLKNRNSRHLQNSFNKYGAENFAFEIVELVPPHFTEYLNNKKNETEAHLLEALNWLNVKEEYYVDFYKKKLGEHKVYNLRDGGSNGKFSQDTKDLMSSIAKLRCEDPEERKRLSEIAKIIHIEKGERYDVWKKHQDEYWEKPENHIKASEAVKKRYEDPNEHIKTSEGLKRFWANAPEEKHKELSDSIKKSWTPERKDAHSIEVSARYENEEYYNKFCESLRKTTSTPEFKEHVSISQKESYRKNPERRKKQSASQKIAQNTPELKQLHSEISTALWKDPEYVNKVVSKTRETKQRNKEAWMEASEHILYFLFEDNPKLKKKLKYLARKHLIFAICEELKKQNLNKTYLKQE